MSGDNTSERGPAWHREELDRDDDEEENDDDLEEQADESTRTYTVQPDENDDEHDAE